MSCSNVGAWLSRDQREHSSIRDHSNCIFQNMNSKAYSALLEKHRRGNLLLAVRRGSLGVAQEGTFLFENSV